MAEGERQESHERLIAALTASQTRTFRWEIATDRIFWDEGVAYLFESSSDFVPANRDEVIQRVHPEDRAALRTAVERCVTQGADLDLPFRVVPTDESVRWVYAKDKMVPSTADHPAYLIGAFTDITRQKWLDEAVDRQERLLQELRDQQSLLAAKNEQLRELATQLTSMEQRERQRIAHLLHDHFQQILVAAQMRLHHLRSKISSRESSQEADRVQELLEEAVEASRTLTTEIYPPVLYNQDFGAALRWVARRFEEKYDLRVEVFADPDAEPRMAAVRLFLLDSVQELLLNVVKHAETNKAELALSQADSNNLRLSVRDYGKGCIPERLNSGPRSTGGVGLNHLRYRVELLGGTVEFAGAPGHGCSITIHLPNMEADHRETPEPSDSIDTPQLQGDDEVVVDRATGIRVILADDHALVRRGLVELLQNETDVDVVGEACDGQEAVDLTLKLRPDVVVMDVTMPNLDGIEATRRITERLPSVRIVGLSMHKDIGIEQAMKAAGASAYLCKGDAPESLVDAIRRCQLPDT